MFLTGFRPLLIMAFSSINLIDALITNKKEHPWLLEEGQCETSDESEGTCLLSKKQDEHFSILQTRDYDKAMSFEGTDEIACYQTCHRRCSEYSKQTTFYDVNSRDYYFDSYSHFGIHEDMMKDQVRTSTYQNAILNNTHLFKGKTVLDVGSGLGILSLFAAQAGAKRVISIECSTIAELSEKVIKDNNMSDIITILKGKVEEVELPDGITQVDVIISEWMGYCLLYESMLTSVIFARDKWLRPGGVMFPDRATIHMTAIEDSTYKQEKIDWWNDVYGFNMGIVSKVAISEPIIDYVTKESVVTTSTPLQTFDLYKVKVEDMSFTVPFSLYATRADNVHALVVYFDVEFLRCQEPTGFSTGPESNYTHWRQATFYLNGFITIQPDEEITGEFSAAPNRDGKRDLDVKISVQFNGENGSLNETNSYRVR